MNYLTHRFSNLASLVMLLVLSVGTAWMFNFAVKINSHINELFDQSAYAMDIPPDVPEAQASSTRR